MLCCLLVACGRPAAAVEYRIETLAEDLEHPWSIAVLPDGRMLVTERAGRLRIIEDGRLLAEPVRGVPEAFVRSQAGLFEVLLDPEYATNGWIYLSLAHGDAAASGTRVVRGRLSGNEFTDQQVIFDIQPPRDTPVHYGARMTFMSDGTLVVGLGDGFDYREAAQRLDSHTGAIVRINPDGSVPADNPFVGQAGALPEIYSYGHRNVQGLVFDHDSGRLWAHEHGPRGGDEVNLVRAGRNYGWPVATFGVDYSGARISPYTSRPGMEDPVLHWTPSIAPSGMTLYRGVQFPEWQGDLLVTALVAREVRRVEFDGERVVAQEAMFGEVGARLRDIKVAPDGALLLLTDSPRGQVLRISAAR